MEEFFSEEALSASFISANSKDGFISLYDRVFAPLAFDRIFVITGGPGTGKSTLLRSIHEKALAKGARAERILCSSDPKSLDGLILSYGTRRVGVLDGTPPHGRIPTYPAVIEEIVHLGALWDASKLETDRKALLALTEEKKQAYHRAYLLLHALGALREEEKQRLLPYLNEEKMRRQIKHKLLSQRKEGEAKTRFLRAISSMGNVILPFSEKDVQNLLFIGGKEGAAEIYLSLFEKMMQEMHLAHTCYLSPLSPDAPDALYLEESKTLLIKERLYRGHGKGRRIVADRFFSLSFEESKDLRRAEEGIQEAAIAALDEAAHAHRMLEKIYSRAVDFSRFEAFADGWIARILDSLGIPT